MGSGVPQRTPSTRLSFSGALSLVAVVAVLVVVSVPRLRGLALLENEADARSTAQLLVAALRDAHGSAAPACLGELLDEKGLVVPDAELLGRGALLRRHGYLFELTRTPLELSFACAPLFVSGRSPELGLVNAVRAWPWKHGATGCAAFLATESGALFVHGNVGALWDGPSAAERGTEGALGWTRLP